MTHGNPRYVKLACASCEAEFDKELTEYLSTPVCPECGYAGDRQVSQDYPFGPLAGRRRDAR